MHWSALALHAEQAAPPAPQVPDPWAEEGTHVPAEQQPVGQLVASQTQLPALHRCPSAHALAPPHRQAPLLEQESPVVPQLTQLAPLAPHCAPVRGVTQVFPAQQPPGQLVALQTQLAPTHAWPAAHSAPAPQVQAPAVQAEARTGSQPIQTLAPVPHWLAVGAPTQAPFEQQPDAQLAVVQPLHCWAVQVCGDGHA